MQSCCNPFSHLHISFKRDENGGKFFNHIFLRERGICVEAGYDGDKIVLFRFISWQWWVF
jgi:hypothetical protein